MQGKFVVFEGLDGSGQSTQVKLLADYLLAKGQQVLVTKEPTKNSPFASEIRRALTEKERILAGDLQMLFAKDRKWHIKKVIEPALTKGEWVISDRYVFSAFAFGVASGLSQKEIETMNANYLRPDLVFFINTSPEICIERIMKRGEGVDLFEKLPILQKVSENYHLLFQKNTLLNVFIIDGNKSISDVFEQIKKILQGQTLQ